MLTIPANSVEISVRAKVWKDGMVMTVEKTMPFQEVRDAIKEAEENYIPSDAVFTLTDLGRKELERMKADRQ